MDDKEVAEKAVQDVFERYELEAKHLVYLKEAYERHIQMSSLLRKTVVTIAIIAVVGWTASGFLADLG